jgi:hypothetical protein
VLEDISVQQKNRTCYITNVSYDFLHHIHDHYTGNVRSSNAVANASTNSSSSSTLSGSKTPFRDLLWCDVTDPDEMDGECLKSSHEQHALWVTDALLHASPLGTY